MRTLSLASTFTAADAEALLVDRLTSLEVVASRSIRCGPAAEARLLGLLASVVQAGGRVESKLHNVLRGAPADSEGWTHVIESPLLHILGHYSAQIYDYGANDVTTALINGQRESRASRGLVTNTGGLTAILELNESIAAGQSRGLFAEMSATSLQTRLSHLAIRRGGKGMHRALIAYAAEAIENVREHAAPAPQAAPTGLSMIEFRRTNRNQFPALRAALPPRSGFVSFMDAIERKYETSVGLLELTVADTGPGIAATLARTDADTVSSSDELEILLSAFSPDATRKKLKGSGGGFTTMLQAVATLDGAVQVRSGRWSLYRTPHGVAAAAAPTAMYSNPRYWEIAEVAPVIGTSITLLTPLQS